MKSKTTLNILGLLAQLEITQEEIGDSCEPIVTRQRVNDVIHERRDTPRIRAAIIGKIKEKAAERGVTVPDLWPEPQEQAA